jgi:protein TonB
VTANQVKRPPLIINLIKLPTDPPPQELLPPRQVEAVPDAPKQPVIVAPPQVVQVAVAPPQVATAPQAPPPRTVVVAPAAQPGPSGPVAASDLSTTMISARPPKYPIESRRKHEQGIVVLSVVVDISGSVADVAVSRSSGFARLDKAALDAVRHWRWSPNVRGGQPVMVKGFVDIPFVLEG